MHIELLTEKRIEEYEKLILSRVDTFVYHSINYRKFLEKVFNGATSSYLIAIKNDRIVGALPAFIKETPRFGKVINSLPFYGSNGGIITCPYSSDQKLIKKALLKAFNDLSKQYNTKSSTIITSPFESDIEIYNSETCYTNLDWRISTVTHLPARRDQNLETALMTCYHQKTRNLVRKGIKNKFSITCSPHEELLDWLHKVHTNNMKEVSADPKPKEIFKAIQDTFTYEKDYKIYVAHKDGEYVAGLLLLYYNRCVEYFIPVVIKEYRRTQALSYLIYTAMLDSILQGYLYWNWGGTWSSQTSLHHFKKRWGGIDSLYYYYTRVYDNDFPKENKSELLSAFQYFYVFPFGKEAELTPYSSQISAVGTPVFY